MLKRIAAAIPAIPAPMMMAFLGIGIKIVNKKAEPIRSAFVYYHFDEVREEILCELLANCRTYKISPCGRNDNLFNGYAYACTPSANSSIIFLLNAGRSSGRRLVTKPLSTTTSSSTQCVLAFFRSVCNEG